MLPTSCPMFLHKTVQGSAPGASITSATEIGTARAHVSCAGGRAQAAERMRQTSMRGCCCCCKPRVCAGVTANWLTGQSERKYVYRCSGCKIGQADRSQQEARGLTWSCRPCTGWCQRAAPAPWRTGSACRCLHCKVDGQYWGPKVGGQYLNPPECRGQIMHPAVSSKQVPIIRRAGDHGGHCSRNAVPERARREWARGLTGGVAPVAEPELPEALLELRQVGLRVLGRKVQRLGALHRHCQLGDQVLVLPATKV